MRAESCYATRSDIPRGDQAKVSITRRLRPWKQFEMEVHPDSVRYTKWEDRAGQKDVRAKLAELARAPVHVYSRSRVESHKGYCQIFVRVTVRQAAWIMCLNTVCMESNIGLATRGYFTIGYYSQYGYCRLSSYAQAGNRQ